VNGIDAKLALRDRLLARFLELAKERPYRRYEVTVDGRRELAWIPFEQNGMLEEVNEIREERGLVRATLEPILEAERICVGHVDYAEKWALYCAEIAMKELP
jgi:hypothetical protein